MFLSFKNLKKLMKMLHECYAGATRYYTITRMLRGSYAGATRILCGCYAEATQILSRCYAEATRMLHATYAGATRMLRSLYNRYKHSCRPPPYRVNSMIIKIKTLEILFTLMAISDSREGLYYNNKPFTYPLGHLLYCVHII